MWGAWGGGRGVEVFDRLMLLVMTDDVSTNVCRLDMMVLVRRYRT